MNLGPVLSKVLKKEQIREEARTILEAAFMPRGTLVPPKMAAGYLESAVFEHHEEDDLGSGKNYLRQLHLLWNWLAPEGESYQPELAVMVASGTALVCHNNQLTLGQAVKSCADLSSSWLHNVACPGVSCVRVESNYGACRKPPPCRLGDHE